MACVIYLSANQYFGQRIDCRDDAGKQKSHYDNYCWMTGSYISHRHFNGTIGKSIISYGVAPDHVPRSEREYQKYYQWVPIFLTIHALIFCVPSYCWKVWERRTMERLIGSLSDEFFLKPEQEGSILNIYNFLLHSHYRVRHRIYALHYLLAELMNLVTVVLNVLLLNFFVEGFWFQFWPVIQMLFQFDYDEWVPATAHLFPRIAKCEYYVVGSSGTIQNVDLLCLLPLNLLNEKIYAGVYLWFLLLLGISVFNVLWELLLLLSRSLRLFIVSAEYREVPGTWWERALDDGRYSQWFLFRKLAKNLSTSIVYSLVDRLHYTDREEYYLK